MVYARIIFFVFAAQAIAGKLEQIGMLKDRKRKSAQMLECWQEGQKNDECKKEYVVMRMQYRHYQICRV